MAESKLPRVTVKHVDGVMHLTVHPEKAAEAKVAKAAVAQEEKQSEK